MFRILPPTFTEAIGWTLLHSLWQGTLIAFLLGILLAVMHRRSAQARYVVSMAALLTLLAAAAATFCTLYFAGGHAPAGLSQPPMQPMVLQAPLPGGAVAPSALPSNLTFSGAVTHYVGQHSPLIVLVWMTGILVLMLRFAGGLAYVHRLKRHQTAAIPDHWQLKASILGRKIGLRRSVRVLESALVKVPVAIGYLKPVILLPAGTFIGLPPQQLEAVLAHEMAHILRNDYWANLLQSLVEILFFYHPALWWMSGLVRREREHCCDDIAVRTCGDSLTFVQALARLETIQSAPRLALAANGGKGSLLSRVQRLLQPAPQKPTFSEGFVMSGILFACLLAVSSGAFANLNVSPLAQTVPQNSIFPKGQTPGSADTPARTTSYSTFTDTNKVIRELVIVKDRKGKVLEVSIDGKKLSKAELENYRPVMAQKLKEMAADKQSEEMKVHTDVDIRLETEVETPIDVDLQPPAPPRPFSAPRPVPAPNMPPMPPVPPFAPPFPFDDEMSEKMENLHEQMEGLREKLGDMDENETPDTKKMAELNKKLQELTREQSRLLSESQANADKQYQRQMKEYSEQMREQVEEYEGQMREYAEEMRRYESDIRGSGSSRNRIWENEHILEDRRSTARQMEIETKRIQGTAKRNLETAARNQSKNFEAHEKAMEAHAKSMVEHEKSMVEHKKSMRDMKRVVTELQKDGLAAEGKPFEFKINAGEMRINGKKQPPALFEKYRKMVEQQLERSFKLNELKDGQWFIIQSDAKGSSSMHRESFRNQKTRAEETRLESTPHKSTLFVEFYNFDPVKKQPSKDGC